MFSYSTKVSVDTDVLKEQLPFLEASFKLLDDPDRKTHNGRSAFSQWNNTKHFLDRCLAFPGGPVKTFETVGESKGGTARVYYQPSVTSLPKVVRKAITVTDPNNVFLFTDLKAAEFALCALFAQEQEAVSAYQKGEDIYMHFAPMFPAGTDRSVIKRILIANMYNKTAYSTSKDLGCSEGQAQYLLDMIARRLPKMTMLKRRIYAYDMRKQGYFAPNGFNQNDLIKVADINPDKGFSADYAASCYIQSALGFFMQSFLNKLLPLTTGTVLTVFDSVLIEHNPANSSRLEEFLLKNFAPLRPDKFSYGKTFWEAAYGE